MSEPKTSIPKFGSFRPKPTPPPPIQDQVEGKAVTRSERDGHEESRSHHERHRSRRSNSKEHRQDTLKERPYSPKHGRPAEKRPSPPPPKGEKVEIFTVDRKGDVKNLVYGSIHRYSVPPFHRAGAGSVLGIPSYVRIDRDYGDEKGIVLSDRREFKSRSREKYIFSKVEKERPQLLKIRPEAMAQGTTIGKVDFVPLQSSRGRKRKRGIDGESSGSDDGETNYRSIHGKAKPRNKPEDDLLQYASESSESETGRTIQLDASTRQKTVELSRKVEEFPHDIVAWLALIDHQEELIRAGDRRVTTAEIRSTADIKIHMYEKALEKAITMRDRETLLLGLMAEGNKIWELKAQSERWEQISKDNIDSLVLWKSYLDFRQTTFGTFQYEEVRDVFLQRMKLILQATGANANNALHDQLVYILLRLTTYIRESGYPELAVAVWQGILEFDFFAPPKSFNSAENINLFKEFWESEMPRIGEDTALGWCFFVQNEDASEAPDAINDEEGNILDHGNLFKSWATAEQIRTRVSRLPARTLDEVVEDDPFRVILASDIEPFLISFPTESEELRTSLLNAFLLFCRLPPLTSIVKASREWSNDPFVGESLLECDPAWIRRQYSILDDDSSGEKQVDISSIFKVPVSNFQNSPESMFGLSWFKSIRAWRDIYGGDTGPVKYDFLRNALKQLLQINFREDLAEFYLAFEWRNEPAAIKKVSKSLLKQHPSSLRLYNAYAMIEWSRGNRDIANGVLSAALQMVKLMPENDRDDSIRLWKSWIWGYLEAGDNSSALTRLLSIETGSYSDGADVRTTPFQLLKTTQHLTRRRDYQLYSGDLDIAIVYAECLALLQYLSTESLTESQSMAQGNITAAIAVYNSFSKTLIQTMRDRNISDTTSSHELFLQSAARFLYHHARIGPFRPAMLRENLTNYLALFPQNTIFLSLYAFNESRLRIANRVRNILSSTVLRPSHDTLTSRLFAIYYEINHGTIHSVRAAFEHALSSTTPASKSSPGLWRFYILYCLQIARFRSKIKDIWYRALRACPWAKGLYIVGFERLGDVEFAELRGTWKVMGEKGLRVHVDLEEKFDEIHEDREGKRISYRS